MKLLKQIEDALFYIPARIVYIFRYWKYVDWRIQAAFYIILFMLMVGTLAVIKDQI